MTRHDLASASLERAGLRVSGAGCTDVGSTRAHNEDDFLAGAGLFVVADGMGGHLAGEVASRLAVDACRTFESQVPLPLSDLERLVSLANDEVKEHGRTHGLSGMGTTLVGVAVVANGGEDDVVVFNVGDSRCYALPADGSLVQVTTDHSVVQEMIEAGTLTHDQARSHGERNVVTRAIGIADHVAADFVVLARQATTRVLLCSDGVSGELEDSEIAHLLGGGLDAAATARGIIDTVLRTPARDNATALVIDLVRIDLPVPIGISEEDTEPRAGERGSEVAPPNQKSDESILPLTAWLARRAGFPSDRDIPVPGSVKDRVDADETVGLIAAVPKSDTGAAARFLDGDGPGSPELISEVPRNE